MPDDQPTILPAVPTAILCRLRDRRALSDLEREEALIEFANAGSLSAYRRLYSGVDLGELPRSPAQQWWDSRKPPLTGVIQPGQLELQEALTKIAGGKVSPRVVALWRRRAAGLVFVRAPDGDAEPRYGYMAFEQWKSGPTPAIAHLLLRLREKPFRGQLCRCKWEQCGRFFFAVRPLKPDHGGGARGAPVREYCPGTDHRAKARKAAAKKRMRDLRAQRARAKRKTKHPTRRR